MMVKVAFYTLGCKVNHYETEGMMDQFKQAGYQIVDFADKADIYIIHSCTVTTEAARKSRQYARRAKRRNPEARVVMAGCYVQVAPEEIEAIEEIDHMLGTAGKSEIVELLSDTDDKNLKKIGSYQQLDDYEDLRIFELQETTRAYIKIEEGCNQFCSYCIIPYARGPVRSREVDSILEEVNNLIRQGVKEIVLTGIHLGAFGYDRGEGNALSSLIQRLLELGPDFRIRLSSLEVTEVSGEILSLLAEEERVCSHLHLPLQSGSDRILKAMNRPYTGEKFISKTKKIKKLIPDIAITTDVIVGFPGETEEDFNITRSLIEEIGFSRLHVFPFSRREGTPAAKMANQINGKIINKRSRELRKLNEELMANFQRKFLNTVRQVLIEEKKDSEVNLFTGFTDNYIKVLIEDAEEYCGQLVSVRLEDKYDFQTARGKII
ncbi:MAG: tRNA (N(6)-L-threonylcarbamoyladenosine(37)-C(2))-methylthiotransferase MtaB [Halanaerobiales bacterium]